MPRSSSRRSPVSNLFAHLSEEERIDQACGLLAIGVLRLAEQRKLLEKHKNNKLTELKTLEIETLHPQSELKEVKTKKESAA